MRRTPLTLLATLFALGGGLTLAATPAGAAGHAPRALHAHAAPAPSGSGSRITSPVPPLSTGYVEVIQDNFGFSQSGGPVSQPTDPSGTGSSLSMQMFANVVGVGPTTIPVTVSTGDTAVPLQVGHIYGTGFTGTVGVGPCSSDDGLIGRTVEVEIDQLTEVSGVVTSAAVQAVCVGPQPNEYLYAALPYKAVPTTPHAGYYTYESDGFISPFGNDSFLVYLGDLSAIPLNQPVVGMAQTADGGGYWMVASDGGIFAFGDAKFYGSMGGQPLNKPIVGMAATPDGKGYWLVASDGGIFAFGDASFYGSMGGQPLNKPIVGMAPAPSGHGYWMVAADGGIFAFGTAPFYGSAGNLQLNKPVVGMVPTIDGRGYWFVASDGGIFNYGDATFHGSAGNIALAQPIVGMAITNTGSGYWLVATDGGIFSYNAPYYGSIPGAGGSVSDVAGLSTLPGLGV